MAERSKELIQTGYYLSKFGTDSPPSRLKTNSWKNAYRMFYGALNAGRTVLEFEHSLKNSRDGYDSHFSSTKRQGWKDKDGFPAELSGTSKIVYDEFNDKDEDYVWSKIESFTDSGFKIKAIIYEDLIGEDYAGSDLENTETEGGIKVRISKSLERSPRLRQMALEIHGYNCQVCNFNFKKAYGEWGLDFAEVHHIVPLSKLKGEESVTNPETDLAVLCANCHRMIHRKKNITLSLDELSAKLKI